MRVVSRFPLGIFYFLVSMNASKIIYGLRPMYM